MTASRRASHALLWSPFLDGRSLNRATLEGIGVNDRHLAGPFVDRLHGNPGRHIEGIVGNTRSVQRFWAPVGLAPSVLDQATNLQTRLESAEPFSGLDHFGTLLCTVAGNPFKLV